MTSRAKRLDRLALSYVPIRLINDANIPTDTRSGCLVDYEGSRYMLTPVHQMAVGQRWMAEVAVDIANDQTQMLQLGDLTFMYLADLGNGTIQEVDLAFTKVANDFESRYQEITPYAGITRDEPRIVFPLEVDVPLCSRRVYGFCGQAGGYVVEGAGYFDPITRIEPDLRYVGNEDDLRIFRLNHVHPGHKYYKGCSGSPILDAKGRVVALVVGGDPENNYIFGIAPQIYANYLQLA